MGSLEAVLPTKRSPLLRASPGSGGRAFFHRPRSRVARFLLSEKVDYFQWICSIGAFFFVVVLFQAFLPGSVVERSGGGSGRDSGNGDLGLLKGIGGLDFGEGIRFVPAKLMARIEKEGRAESEALSQRPGRRVGLRRPLLALVFADLWPDATQLQMVSIAVALKGIGYEIEVHTFEGGPALDVWKAIGTPVFILPHDRESQMAVDWLNYNGIVVNSLEARPILSCLLQEPFKSIPVIWNVHESSLALRLSVYAANDQIQLVNDWKQVFSRATVVVFPTYLYPLIYSVVDAGNFFVIPGYPEEAWGANHSVVLHERNNLRSKMGYESDDFLIAIVGSQFSYSGLWLEHALVLHALSSVLHQFSYGNSSNLKVVILSDNSTSTYKMALEKIAPDFGYPRGSVQHIILNGDFNNFLGSVDLVIYGSFLEEQSFPAVLKQAMCRGKLVVAPDLGMIRKYVNDSVHGYFFPKENIGTLSQIFLQIIENGQLSRQARDVASAGRVLTRNLMVSESIEGYASLLEKVLKFPSEIIFPSTVDAIPVKLKEAWRWHLFENISVVNAGRTFRDYGIVGKIEERWNRTLMEKMSNSTSQVDEAFLSISWADEKLIMMANARKRLEDEELKDRTDQPHGTWEDVYRSVKRADRAKNELHERDDRELERTGQPLCIYEPYFGEGTWPFLHNTSLYRGIGLSSKGRRPGADDIDASSRLPLLGNAYYRDALGEYGAFFALANRIDRIHKNAWIGFQSWRVVARKGGLSRKAELALLEDIQARKHGDTLYFWVRMDKDPRNPLRQDFWTFCDALNAGNCRYAVSETLRKMYGVQHDLEFLPQMPVDGDSWSVMHSWAMPTRSFLEFVMFSRMFVDALDAQIHDEHHRSGRCYLSLSKDRHCYSRLLELLVNVWAYHSARRMIYVNPASGEMQEHHKLKSRRGQMWIKWFSFSTLKSMDEDLAEEADSDQPNRRWLWPSTGEVFWQGIYEKERNMRHQQKERRKQQSRDKIQRIKKRARQKTLGKFIKPPPESPDVSNTTHNP
ncbi:putative glycosyl transferase, family 1 [Dioscorea sansibarensis]